MFTAYHLKTFQMPFELKGKRKVFTSLLFFFHAFLHLVKDGGLVAKYFTEAAHIIAGKAGIHFTIFAKLAAH
jgi:hypothetical protein